MDTTRYLMTSGETGAIVDVPRSASSDDYGRWQKQFASDHEGGFYGYAEMWRLVDWCKHRGVYWDEELAGPGGASFVLFCLPENPKEDIDAAEDYIRRGRDVVRLRRMKIRRLVDFPLAD